MSVTGCDVDHNQSNDSDFCCTEEELFESFMEIVNDPELQKLSNNNQDITEENQMENKTISDEEKSLSAKRKESEKGTDSNIYGDHSCIEGANQSEHNGTFDYNEVSSEECPHGKEVSEYGLKSLKNEEQLSSTDDDRNTVESKIDQESTNTKTNTVFNAQDSSVNSAGQGNVERSGTNVDQEQDLKSNQTSNTASVISAQQNEQNSSTFDPEQMVENKAAEPGLDTTERNQSNLSDSGLMSRPLKSTNSGNIETFSSIILSQPTSQKPEEVDGFSSSPKVTTSRGSELLDSSVLLPLPTSPKAKEVGILSEQKPSSPRASKAVSSILLRQPNSFKRAERDVDSTNQTEANVSPTNQNEPGVSSANENEAGVSSANENEAGVCSTNQSKGGVSSANENEAGESSANENEAGERSANENEAGESSANQHKAEESPANQNEEGVSATNQNKLEIIEHNIEESIRRTNKVCEELAALTQRLSQSSDELLADNDSEQNNLRTVNNTETAAVNNAEVSDDNDISKQDSKDINSQSDNNLRTAKNESSDKGDDPTIRPESLSKLIVTSQPSSPPPISPKPKFSLKRATPTTSPSTESFSSTQGFSPTHIMHLRDENPGRKLSASDSLNSSEGSLSGGGASPSLSEGRGPIDWEILNSALRECETDEDDNVYESSGTFGGFGLALDDDSSIATVDDIRSRLTSQSSTVSELEFQKQYKTKYSTGSLDRNADGMMCSGYLFKLGGTGITPKNWRKRWCVLRHDRCLYYYKSAKDKMPSGIVVLANYIVSPSSECNKKNCIKISKGGGRTYFFCSETQQDMLRWMDALRKAAEIHDEGTTFGVREEIIHNVAIPALSIKKPDCHGYLTKQGAKSIRSWKRRYCVLKNGCLYYYREMADTTALGVAKLHGYTVDEEISMHGRRNGFRCVPPRSGMRTFTFVADNEYDKKRWIPCFRESIQANAAVVDS